MGLGQVALGVASVVMGINHLRNAQRHLAGVPAGHGLDGVAPRRARHARHAPIRVPGRSFMDSGEKTIRTRGGNIPMRMRSFNIRTLDDRIAYLQKLADQGKRDPEIYAFVRRAIGRKCGNKWCIDEKDNLGEARALFGALRQANPPRLSARDVAKARSIHGRIRSNVRYTSDIAGVDTYQKPSHTLALHAGDCDDYSSLTCAALGSIGIPCRYKVIRTKGAKDWNHIYAQAGFPRAKPVRWISMDSSVSMPFGWEAPARMVAASKVFRVR